MKKSLLLMAALGICGTSFAQLRTEMTDTKVMMTDFVKAAKIDRPMMTVGKTTDLSSSPRRSKETGLYYSKPAGALYWAWDKSGSGYGPTYISVPAWQDFTFKNLSEKPTETLWHGNYPGNSNPFRDLTPYAEENGDYIGNLEAGYFMAAPTVADKALTDSFTIGAKTNYYWSQTDKAGNLTNPNYYTRVVIDSVTTLGFTDDHAGGYSFGSMSTGYLYGTGNIEYDNDKDGKVDEVGVCRYIMQSFPKPASPLYVEDVYFNCLSDGPDPLPEGKELTLSFYDTIIDDKGRPGAADTDPFLVLKATKADLEGDGQPNTVQYTQTGVYYRWCLTFSNKVVDEFGIETTEPFVLDRPFTVILSGIDGEGVSIGFTCNDINAEDEPDFDYNGTIGAGYFVVEVPDGAYQHYYSASALNMSLTGMMDGVIVADALTDSEGGEFENCNVLFVSDDGSECGVAAGDDGYFPGVYVYTANYWKDTEGTGDEYYYLDELPDWVTEVTVDDSYYMNPSYDYPAFNIVGVKAEALPSGTKGRFVKTFVKGRGVTSEIPIIIVQGEVDPSEYLTPAEQEGDIYNFAAAAAAEENPENLNGGAAQKFAFWDIKNEKNDARQDFKGYQNYTGANLPAECHVWRRSDRINGNVKDGGLQCPNDRVMVIDGLYNGAEVTIEYTTADGKNIVYCPSTEQQNEVTINGEAAVTGVSEIASGAKVVMEKAWDGYFAFQVFKGMVITKIVINNKSTDTGIKTVKEVATATSGSIFNLAGQRVSAPVRGQIYVKDGKKFIVK